MRAMWRTDISPAVPALRNKTHADAASNRRPGWLGQVDMRAGPKREPERKKLPALRAKTPSGRVQEFFRRFLRHVKGDLAGKPLKLAPWAVKDLIEPIFDQQLPDKSRQIRTCYCEVPRKNAKSTLAAGLGLYLLYADNEPGPEIVSAASDRDQAAI